MANVDKEGDSRIVLKLIVLVVVMFAAALWAMPPLYYTLCKVLGINTRTSNVAYQAEQVKVDTSRTVKVQFVATNSAGMVWDFHPNTVQVEVHPGEPTKTTFFARNPSGLKITGQAVPSVVPARATEFFHKTECFCFNQQILEAGQAVNMPLVFIIDQALPADIHTITLSYTLYDVTNMTNEGATPAPDEKTVPNNS